MDLGSIMKMMNGGKDNPVLNQLMGIKTMLEKLPKEEQVRVVTNFVNELQLAVNKAEGKTENVETKDGN